MFGWELATAPPRNVRIAGFAAWGRGGKPKADQPSGEDPKAKPFFCDNSANKNATDWILGQLSKRTCFAPGLHALPLLRSSTLPCRPVHGAVSVSRASPRCRIRVPRQSMAPYPCSMPIHSGVSVFHTDPWRCHEAVPRVQNRKSACSATFLRLGIATDPCNRRLGRKSAGGLLQSGCFRLCGGRGESLIAKKLQKRSDFCFCGRWIATAGQISQRMDRRSGVDCTKGGSLRRGRLRKELVQRGAYPPTSILSCFLLATMLQFA